MGGCQGETRVAPSLKDRSFRVKFESLPSNVRLMLGGVHSGSVLKPPLFLIYVNILTTGLENPCFMSADEMKLSQSATSKGIWIKFTDV